MAWGVGVGVTGREGGVGVGVRGGGGEGVRRSTRAARKGAHAGRGGARDTRGDHDRARKAHVHHAEKWSNGASRT